MTIAPVPDGVLCPYCRKPVDAKVEHPIRFGDWMVYCGKCDVWTVVPIRFAQEQKGPQ